MRSFTYAVAAALVAGFAQMAQATPVSNLVQNGSFETGSFSNWSLSGNTGYTSVNSGYSESGTYAALFGPVGSVGTLSQMLTTVAGDSYTVSFWLENMGSRPNSFSASFGSSVLTSLTNARTFGYTLYSYVVTATSSTTNLSFSFRQDPSYWALDNVSVTSNAVPPEVSPVPLPAALPLLGVGLAGFAVVGKRRKKADKA